MSPRPLIVLSSFVLLLGGCSPYQLRGTVVEGPVTRMEVVDAGDTRLAGDRYPPVGGAAVAVTVDPDRLSAKPKGAATTDTGGNFSLKVDEFGAGSLKYDVGVTAGKAGYQTATDTFPLPGRGKRVLIMIKPGDDRGRELPNPSGRDLIDETIREGERGF